MGGEKYAYIFISSLEVVHFDNFISNNLYITLFHKRTFESEVSNVRNCLAFKISSNHA